MNKAGLIQLADFFPNVMRTQFFNLVLVISLLAGSACSWRRTPSPVVPSWADRSCVTSSGEADRRALYVVNRGPRLGIVLRSDDAVEELGWVTDEVHNYPWIEVSWGEWEDLLPQRYDVPEERRKELKNSVSHLLVRGFLSSPEEDLRPFEVVRISLLPSELETLIRALRSAFLLSEFAATSGSLQLSGREGTLYPSALEERYAFSAATWYANLLADAGCPLDRTTKRAARLLDDLRGKS